MDNKTSNANEQNKNSSPGLEFNLYSSVGDEFEIFLDIPIELQPIRLPGFKVDLVKGKFGKMFFYNYKGIGFEIWISLYLIDHSTVIIGKANRSILEWHNAFKNSFKSTWSGIILPDPKQGQFNMSYVPHVENKAEFMGGNCYMTCDFHFTTKLLSEYSDGYPELYSFLNKIEQQGRNAHSISSERLFLTREMEKEINSILNFKSHPICAPKFYESNVSELLMLMLDRITEYECGFTPKQKRAAMLARDIINADPSKAPTTAELSKRVDLDECTLKRCFKTLFSTTIYQFARQKKIEHAKKLLLDPKLDSLDVALEIGYEHTSQLWDLFKKVAGITPRQWQQMNNAKSYKRKNRK